METIWTMLLDALIVNGILAFIIISSIEIRNAIKEYRNDHA